MSFGMDFFEPWTQYKHACVRQLAFCIASPNIINTMPNDVCREHLFDWHTSTFWKDQFERYQVRLEYLDQDPTELIEFLSSLKSTRLGLRFEMLLWFWLKDEDYHCYHVLGHSLQQIEGARTLGELDFLILNKQTEEIEHWEVALKYYLAEAQGWFGLNRSDTLYKKLQHFTMRQFQFSHTQQHIIQKKYAVMKGQLYLPYQQKFDIPDWLNTSRRTGFWGNKPVAHLYRLQRQEWIIPNETQSSGNAYWWTDGLYCNAEQNFFYMFRYNLNTF